MGACFQVSFLLMRNFPFSHQFPFFFCCSRYDLYTKGETIPDIENLWPYYQGLIDKYCPGELEF